MDSKIEPIPTATLHAAAEDARLIERLLFSPQVQHSDPRRIRIVAQMLKLCLREIERGSKIVTPRVVDATPSLLS